jgi:arylsulfatase A-like enzyme
MKLFLSLITLALGLQAAIAADGPRPPNFVFILADDLGTAPVGAYGNPYFQTPHIDRLAREGMRFDAAYAACPVCSPTRAAIMTGQYPARTRITDFIAGGNFPAERLLQPNWQKFLPLSAITLAEDLREHGYVTALFGKWHLARAYTGPESVDEGPDRQGFDETFITHKPSKDHDPDQDPHGVAGITDRAVDFLGRHRGRPFFLELAHNSIHAPIMAPKDLIAKHRARAGSDRPENNPVIAAMMEILDASVGRVLARLDELGLRDNTVVVFYSDNGGLLADASQFPLRGGKAQLYEGGIRVPLIVRWPGVVAAGSVSAMPVTSVDFLPTLLELTGRPLPAGRVGISLAGHLRGAPAPAREAIYWHYPHYHSAGDGGPASAIRAGDWKLIEYHEHSLTGAGRAPELFNLATDPAEARNLADAEPARTRELLAKLAAYRSATGAQMPTVNPHHDPAVAGKRKKGGEG